MVKTALCPEQKRLKIFISDNGLGMTESIKTKVLDHLFTTKEVGKGTGLGLTRLLDRVFFDKSVAQNQLFLKYSNEDSAKAEVADLDLTRLDKSATTIRQGGLPQY